MSSSIIIVDHSYRIASRRRKVKLKCDGRSTASISTTMTSRSRRRRRQQHHHHHMRSSSSSLLVLASILTLSVFQSRPFSYDSTTTTTTVDSFCIPDPVVHFGVGAVAGGTGAFVAFPFEYIKTQMQTEYGQARWKNGMEAFVDIVTSSSSDPIYGGGPLQLYKGLGVQLLGIAPEKGIKMGVNDVLASTFLSSMGYFPLWGQVLSGAMAGACQVVASSPLEVMKVGLQTSGMTLEEVWTDVGGIRGLFRGAQACMLRDILWTAICFPLYTLWVHQSVPTFVAGAASGVVASFLATPADVVKTRILSKDKWTEERRKNNAAMTYQHNMAYSMSNSTLMIEASADHQQQGVVISDNPWTVFCDIFEREGPAVLFSGVTERCVGGIPRFGTTMAVHDFLEHSLSHAGWLTHSLPS